MQSRKLQSGMTMWGLLFVLGVIAFMFFIFFKLLPPYITDSKVSSALLSLSKKPDVETMNLAQIKESVRKTLEIDNADNDIDLNKTLTLEQAGKMKVIRINYEAVVPLAGNISALLTFDHSLQVKSVD